jgi:TolB protein
MKLTTQLLTLALALMPVFAAEDLPDITRLGDASKLIPLSISGYSGEVDSVLKFDLGIAGFAIVAEDQAHFNLSGSNSDHVEGRLTDRAKNSKLGKSYAGGSLRTQAHALADDVVQTLLGTPGISRTKIAFKRDMGSFGEIYIADYDGFNPVAVTSDKALVASPTWGPGRRMLYYTSYRATYPDIYSHDLTTGDRKAFARYAGSNLSPSVSRDGSKVAMILSKDGSPDLYVADASGGNLRQLTKTKDAESSPTWSPDGSKICYTMDEARGLYVISASGGAPRKLPSSGGRPTEPDWSPDGKTIVFTTQNGSHFSLYTVPADGSAAPTGPLVEGEDPSWAPNSRTVVFVRRVGGQRVLSLLDVPSKTVKPIPAKLGNCSQPCWSK